MPDYTYLSPPPAWVPERADVHAFLPPAYDPEHLVNVATELGLTDAPSGVTTGPFGMTYRSGPHHLSLLPRSGSLRYRIDGRYGIGRESFEVTNEQAIAAAVSYVQDHQLVAPDLPIPRMTGLLNEDVVTAGDNGEIVDQRTIEAGVVLGRVVGGIAVDGAGGSVIVHIDADRSVTGFELTWRTRGPVLASVDVIGATDAQSLFEELTAGLDGRVIVTKWSFVYFEHGELVDQESLEPAYFFVYTGEHPVGRSRDHTPPIRHRSVAVIPAGSQVFSPPQLWSWYPGT